MTVVWFKVDDGFYTSQKVLSIPRTVRLPAVGLWTMAGNWSGRELADGKVPNYVLAELGSTPRLRRSLVEARLWLDHGSAGIEFHSWSDYQPTRADVEAERAKTAERQRKWRDRQKGETSDQHVSHTVTNSVTNGVSHAAPTRPDPTRPIKEKNIAHPSDSPSAKQLDEMFDTFWQAWPVKKGKEPARKSFIKAIKAGADMAAIMAGVEAYKVELGTLMGGKTIDGRTPKYAQGWLTDKRWTDEPSTASVADINAQWDAAMSETKNPCANGHKWAADDSCARCLQLKHDNDERRR